MLMLILLLALCVTGCGDSEKPKERDDRKLSVTPAEPTATTEVTPTDVPEITPTPEVSPTGEPEITPTPEVNPTGEPELSPTPEVNPTGEPELSPTPEVSLTGEPEITPTPEATPTAEPELTPTPEVTPTTVATPTPTTAATPTPTPTPTAKLPTVAVKPGPQYVIGTMDRYNFTMDDTDESVGFHVDMLYITDTGCKGLMERILDTNVAHNKKCYDLYSEAADIALAGSGDVTRWYYNDRCGQFRSDTKVFSYSRTVETYLGGAHGQTIRYGYNFDTKTGEPLTIDRVVNDYDRTIDLVISTIEADPYNKDVFMDDNWKKTIRSMFKDGSISWLATEDGLEVWVPEGEIAAIAAGEICAKLNIKDYPDLIKPAYVGNYNHAFSMQVVNYDEYRSTEYNKTIKQMIQGIGSLSWQETVSMAKNAGIAYEGKNDKDAAAEESNAYLDLTEKASGYRYHLYYTTYASKDVQRLTSINFIGEGGRVYVDNAYGSLPVRYVLIDPWVDDANDYVADIHFRNADELSMIFFVTIAEYYKK